MATEHEDYLPFSGTLSFPPGTETATIGVALLGIHRFEADETFFPRPGTADRHHLEVGTILDHDVPD